MVAHNSSRLRMCMLGLLLRSGVCLSSPWTWIGLVICFGQENSACKRFLRSLTAPTFTLLEPWATMWGSQTTLLERGPGQPPAIPAFLAKAPDMVAWSCLGSSSPNHDPSLTTLGKRWPVSHIPFSHFTIVSNWWLFWASTIWNLLSHGKAYPKQGIVLIYISIWDLFLCGLLFGSGWAGDILECPSLPVVHGSYC